MELLKKYDLFLILLIGTCILLILGYQEEIVKSFQDFCGFLDQSIGHTGEELATHYQTPG